MELDFLWGKEIVSAGFLPLCILWDISTESRVMFDDKVVEKGGCCGHPQQ